MWKQILWTACITPFNQDDFSVDYESLEKTFQIQNNAGNGILIMGSTGESLSLSNDERLDILKFTCNQDLTTEIIVGVPAYNIDIALEWIEKCNDYSIDGYLISTPMYTKPGYEGQLLWFSTLLDKAKHPVMLYNIPGRTGISLHKEVVKKLYKHPMFGGIKDSSGNIHNISEWMKDTSGEVQVYCGDDNMIPSMAPAGAHGLVSVASNAWAKETRLYVKDSLEGNSAHFKNNNIWYQAIKYLFSASNPIPIKYLMKEKSIITSSQVRPPLNIRDLSESDEKSVIEYDNIIKEIYNGR